MVNQQKPSKPTVTPEETKFRKKIFPDIKEIKNKNLLCTSCGTSVKDLISKGKPISHSFMGTLLCRKCFTFYGDGQFSEDEDGCDKYCRWCGQGGTLFLCSSCTAGFCKRCVKRNLPKSAQLELEKDDWECYCCNPTPLFELRAQCWAAEEYAIEYANKSSSSSSKSKSSKSSSKKKRPRDSSSGEEEISSKSKSSKSSSKKKRPRDSGSDDEEISRQKKKSRSVKQDESSAGEEDEEKKASDVGKNKSKKKNDKSERENGDEEEKPRRSSLREKKNIKTEDEIMNGLKKSQWNMAIKFFDDLACDYAKMTKGFHKTVLDYKTKKLNLKYINTEESFDEVQRQLDDLFVKMSSCSLKLRDSMNKYCEDWKKEAALERDKINKDADSNKIDDACALENGIANDPSEGNKADNLRPTTSEDINSEQNESISKEKNSKISEDPEKEPSASTQGDSDEKMDVDAPTENVKESAADKDSPSPVNEENGGEGTVKELSENCVSPEKNKSDPKEINTEEPYLESNNISGASPVKESSSTLPVKESSSSSPVKESSSSSPVKESSSSSPVKESSSPPPVKESSSSLPVKESSSSSPVEESSSPSPVKESSSSSK